MNLARRHLAYAVLATAAITVPSAALASAEHARARSAGTHTVVLSGLRFHPSTVVIKRGESVKWVWRDGGIAHNVTGHGFHSNTQSSGSLTVRFTHSGTFRYECTIHVGVGMVGKVVVH